MKTKSILKNLLLILIITFLCGISLAQSSLSSGKSTSDMRTWSSKSGHNVEASLVEDRGKSVILRTSNGRIQEVRKNLLSDDDMEYLKKKAAPIDVWPCWRNSNRDGKSKDTGLLDSWPEQGPEKIWEVNNLGKGFSGVSIADGLIYISGEQNGQTVIYALNMDGKEQWKQTHGKSWTKNYPGPRATVTIDGDKVYFLSGVGKLTCYNARTGSEIWTRTMSEFGGKPHNWGYAESPLVIDDKVIVTPGQNKCMVALDKTTGRTRWVSKGNEAQSHYCSAIVVPYGNKKMIINGNKGGIFAVNGSNGDVLWSNGFCSGNTANVPTPAYSDDHVFWANGYGKGGICLKLSSNQADIKVSESWRTKEMVCHHGGFIIHEGYIYGNHGKGWTCLDLKTGQKMWNDRGVGKGSICYADGMLYIFGERGGKVGLAKASPEGFEMTGSFQVSGSGPSWAHPVVTGGRLYLRYGKNLYCFNVKAK